MSPEFPARPELIEDVPTYRFWGTRKPPKNKADWFRASSKESTKSGTAGDKKVEKTEKVATLRMYGPIDAWGGMWGISARDVSEALDSVGDVDRIVVRINSPGGDAWEGLAVLNMLRAHKANVTAVVDGIAASAASYIATGVDETVMSPGTQLMIHDASAFAYGNAEVMVKAKSFLDSVSESIASLYAEAAGGTQADWRTKMRETTWYTADEAVESKLADKVAVVSDLGAPTTAGDDDAPELEAPEDAFDLSMYPAAHVHPGTAPVTDPPNAGPRSGHPNPEGGTAVAFSDEQLTTMRAKLELPETADEAAIVAAITSVVDESLEDRPAPAEPVIPDGHVVIPAAKLADLEAGAALATTTANTLAAKERDAFLDGPEARGKYLPTSREGWSKEYDRDPAGVRAHFATAPILVPLTELGHDNPVAENVAEEDAAYYAMFPDEKVS